MNSPNISLPLPPGFEGKTRKRYTLALIQNDGHVLLGLKKRGFGKGLWNGFGGKIEVDETDKDAAVREIEEECGLIVNASDLEQFGVILFEFLGDPVLMEVHLFRTETFAGEEKETEEMMPKWFPVNALPHSEMWADDEIWYPLYLRRQKFNGYFLFEGQTKILSYVLRDLSTPEEKVILEKLHLKNPRQDQMVN